MCASVLPVHSNSFFTPLSPSVDCSLHSSAVTTDNADNKQDDTCTCTNTHTYTKRQSLRPVLRKVDVQEASPELPLQT